MSTHGILIMDFKDEADAQRIQGIISPFYTQNSDVIEGMAYYETEDEKLVTEIQKLCEE